MTLHLASLILSDPALPHESEYTLPPITLWAFESIDSVHVLPSRLRLDLFLRAVGLAAGRVRGAGGRFRRRERSSEDGGRGRFTYFISLIDSPMPVEHLLVPFSSSLPANRDVVRNDLGPFIPKVKALVNSEEPLFRIRITEEVEGEGRTVLSFSWFHGLGDAAAFSLLLSSISTIYSTLLSSTSETIDLPSLSLPQPTTTHLHFDPPSDEAVREFAIVQTEPLPMAEVSRRYKEGASGSQSVMIRLSKKELGILKAKASGEDASSWISTQDALSSWYVEVLRSCGVEAQDVINAINYRSLPPLDPFNSLFPVPLTYLTGNVAQMRASPISPPSTPPSLVPTAQALRADLHALAEPQRLYDWLSVQAERLERATDEGMGHCVLPTEGSVAVNSNLRFDWNLPFGYPQGSTSYHSSFSGYHFLRVFQPNPYPGDEAASGGGAELVFSVRSEIFSEVVELMEKDRREGWERLV